MGVPKGHIIRVGTALFAIISAKLAKLILQPVFNVTLLERKLHSVCARWVILNSIMIAPNATLSAGLVKACLVIALLVLLIGSCLQIASVLRDSMIMEM